MQGRIQEALMAAARAEAERSCRQGGIPVGAVLAAEDGTIVACGHNQRVQSGDPTIHGETQCIRNAGRRRDWSDDIGLPRQKNPASGDASQRPET
jgi:creatinine deaminase